MILIENVFVDTSAWIAVTNKNDFYHQKAVSAYPSILKHYRYLCTSNLVIAETYNLILNEMGYQFACRFIEISRISPKILKIYSDNILEEEAENILKKYDDQDFSYADAVSFAIMKKKEIKKAFSFDKHFWTAGFKNILESI